MKYIGLILVLFSLSGCAMLGTNMIHSPSCNDVIPITLRHVHGGALRHANAMQFKLKDSSFIIISARTIWEKINFMGVIFPIFPTFWLPKKNFYKQEPDCLIIEVSSSEISKKLEIVSATIQSDNKVYELESSTQTDWQTELKFPLNARQTKEFELIKIRVYIDNEPVELPVIKFRKTRQRWRFIGP